jgi:hypothetical protein
MVVLAFTAASLTVSAHRVIGRVNPAGNTALVQSPTASPADLPVPIFNTGLSVICFRVTNTSTSRSRITAVGVELPGDRSGFSLVTPLDRGLTLHERVEPLPGFTGVSLDFALMVGTNFSGGHQQGGLAPSATPVTICVSGPFDAVPIETLLNGVFVAFREEGATGDTFDLGVWERR